MRFTPLNEEDCLRLLPDGEYPFLVENAESARSKSGSEMIKLTLSVHDSAGRNVTIYDYLLEALMFKVKHFADAVGMQDKYEAGGYEATDCIGKKGICKVGRQEAQNGYPPKNTIRDYLAASEKQDKSVKDEFKADLDIPF